MTISIDVLLDKKFIMFSINVFTMQDLHSLIEFIEIFVYSGIFYWQPIYWYIDIQRDFKLPFDTVSLFILFILSFYDLPVVFLLSDVTLHIDTKKNR